MKNQKTGRRWKRLFAMQEKSGESVKDFCKKAGVHYSQFYRQYKQVTGKSFGQTRAHLTAEIVGLDEGSKENSELFIEFETSALQGNQQPSSCLKLSYREMAFELEKGFDADTFKRALGVVREVL